MVAGILSNVSYNPQNSAKNIVFIRLSLFEEYQVSFYFTPTKMGGDIQACIGVGSLFS